MSEITKCPHCGGELKEQKAKYIQWQYDCMRCGRAWIILDEIYWLAGFDAEGHIYKIENEKIEAVRTSTPLWKELWDRVR